MGVNLHTELSAIRAQENDLHYKDVLIGYKALLGQSTEGERILTNLFRSKGNEEKLDFNALNPSHIYHIADIKALCINFRLRFLDSKLFRGTFPVEAIEAIKTFQSEQNREITGFKMIAPAPMFKLAEKDKDPLLMVPMGGDYYYLLAKWGNDLHPLRKVLVYPFRDFESLLKTVFAFCLAVALLFPESLIRSNQDTGTIMHLRVILFFWMFFSTSAMTVLYGFSRVKNFNTNLWKSKYLD